MSALPGKREVAARLRAQEEADRWNEAHPVGAVVVVCRDSGDDETTRTRSTASVTHSGHPVIFLDGITGYYLLSRVHAVDVGKILDWHGVVLG